MAEVVIPMSTAMRNRLREWLDKGSGKLSGEPLNAASLWFEGHEDGSLTIIVRMQEEHCLTCGFANCRRPVLSSPHE